MPIKVLMWATVVAALLSALLLAGTDSALPDLARLSAGQLTHSR